MKQQKWTQYLLLGWPSQCIFIRHSSARMSCKAIILPHHAAGHTIQMEPHSRTSLNKRYSQLIIKYSSTLPASYSSGSFLSLEHALRGKIRTALWKSNDQLSILARYHVLRSNLSTEACLICNDEEFCQEQRIKLKEHYIHFRLWMNLTIGCLKNWGLHENTIIE